MTSGTTTVSVVIPVLNAARTLSACLSALESLVPRPLEILLVDNGSTDGSLELLQTFARRHPRWVRLLEEHRRGASVARNTGARHAAGEVIAFTDSDCAPRAAWLAELAASFADAAVGAVAGRIEPATTGSTVELFSALYTLQSPQAPARYLAWTPTSGGFPTANLAIRRDVFRRLNGFDEAVAIYGEDHDLCARLYALGLAIVYRPECVVVHHHRTNVRALLRQAFGFGRSHAYLLSKQSTAGLWIEGPRRPITRLAAPFRAWVNLVAADKKMLGMLALGALWRPFWWLLPLYGCWLARDAAYRAARLGVAPSASALVELATLHLLKAGAITAGRWWGTVRYGVLCF